MQLKKIFWTFGTCSGKKSWRALEDNAILYNTDRFIEGRTGWYNVMYRSESNVFVVLLRIYSKCKFWCWCFIRGHFICHWNKNKRKRIKVPCRTSGVVWDSDDTIQGKPMALVRCVPEYHAAALPNDWNYANSACHGLWCRPTCLLRSGVSKANPYEFWNQRRNIFLEQHWCCVIINIWEKKKFCSTGIQFVHNEPPKVS